MKFVQKFRENRQKLKHIRQRAKVILPLCEEATGIKLKGKLKIEKSSKLKHKFRQIVDVFMAAFPSQEIGGEPEPVLALVYMVSQLSYQSTIACRGYFDPSRVLVGFNLDKFGGTEAADDYLIAHEITHLLIDQSTFKAANEHLVVCEGAATFYGAKAVAGIHPSFNVASDDSFAHAEYKNGYLLFERIAAVVNNPLLTVCQNPPRKFLYYDDGAYTEFAHEKDAISRYAFRIEAEAKGQFVDWSQSRFQLDLATVEY